MPPDPPRKSMLRMLGVLRTPATEHPQLQAPSSSHVIVYAILWKYRRMHAKLYKTMFIFLNVAIEL